MVQTRLEQQQWLSFQLTFLTDPKLAGSLQRAFGMSPCVLFAKYLWMLLVGFAELKEWMWVTQKIFSPLRSPVGHKGNGQSGTSEVPALAQSSIN